MTQTPVKYDPEKAKNYLIHADYHIKDGNYNDALNLLNEIIFGGLDPTNLEAHFKAVDIFLKPDVLEPARALEILDHIKPQPDTKDIHNLSPQDVKVLFHRAKALLQKPERVDWENSKKLLEIVLEVQHTNLEAVEMRADFFYKVGEYVKAIEIYNGLLNQSYLPEQMMYSLAVSYYEIKEPAWSYFYVKELYKIYRKQDPFLDELSQKVNKSLYDEVIKPDHSLSFLNKFLMKNLPFLAIEKIASHVEKVVDQKRMYAELYKDNLSGCWNDRGFKAKIPEFYQQAKKEFFLCSIDINYFRAVNNCLGHDMGDLVVKAFGRLLQQTFPDNAYRLSKGGDEFFWTLDATEQDAIQRAVSFRKSAEKSLKEMVNGFLKEKPLRDLNNKLLVLNWNVTITQGLAKWEKGMTLEELKSAADFNSEESKKTVGRNSVIYQRKAVDKGEEPINYTHGLLLALDQIGVTEGFPDWWKYKESLKPEELSRVLKRAESMEAAENEKLASARS